MNKLGQRITKLRANLARWIQPDNQRVVDKYELSLREWLIYHQKEIIFSQVSWMGVNTQRHVLDNWIYQEILYEVQPDIVVEIGSFRGGSTLYLAHLMDIIGKGSVLSVDIDRRHFQVSHNRIITLTGDSQSSHVIAQVAELTKNKSTLIIHDGNHEKEHVFKDLMAYAEFVTIGSYLIVEDGIVDIMGVDFEWYHQGGPVAATEAFLAQNKNFEVDEKRERYLLTYNPKGYLKRIN